MKKIVGLVVACLLFMLVVILTSPYVDARNPEYEYISYQEGYQIATVQHVDGCVPDKDTDICMVIISHDGVLSPDIVNNQVKEGDNVYKECRMKLGKAECSHYWKSWIGEVYLQGGKI